MNYFYDTNIIIYYFSKYNEVKQYFTKEFLVNNNISISIITRIELLAYPNISDIEELKIKNLLKQFKVLYLTTPIEEKTIKIKRQYSIKLPDAIIAASAIITNSKLLTRNTDDFKNIGDLTIENPFNFKKF